MKIIELLVLVTLVLISYVGLNYSSYGASFDEIDQIKMGGSALNYYSTGFKDKLIFDEFDKRLLVTRSVIPDMYAVMGMKLIKKINIEAYHNFVGLLIVPLVLAVVLVIYINTRSLAWAFFSCFSLLTFSRLSGNFFNNSKDLPFAAFVAILVLVLNLFRHIKTNVWIVVVLLGALFGILGSLRLGLLLLISPPTTYFILKTLNLNLRKLFLMFCVTILTWLWLSPGFHGNLGSSIFTGLRQFVKFKEVGTTLFEGVYMSSDSLPWYYLTKYLLLTMPEYLLVGLIITFISIRKKLQDISVFLILWTLLTAAILKPNIYDGWRHFLFLGPLIVIVSINSLYQSRRYIYVITPLIVYSLFIHLRLFPYEYSYFNMLGGSFRNVSINYETEYWGGSFKEATTWLNKNAKLPIYSCVPHLTKIYLDKSLTLLETKPTDRQYLYTCFNRLPKYNYIEGNSLFKIERNNVVLHEIKLVN